MTPSTPSVRPFLEQFGRLCTEGSIPELTAIFAETFLAADPGGSRPVTASDFALALPRRRQMFDQLGCTSTELISTEETPLDSRYVLARTRWRMEFSSATADRKEIFVDSSYLVDACSEPQRILVYLAHQDLMTVLRERRITA